MTTIATNERNPIHYGAMSKYTKCYKTLEAMLNLDLEQAPDNALFLGDYFKIQELEGTSNFDPRMYKNVLKEFKHLLDPLNYSKVVESFKHSKQLLLREVLNHPDKNHHTPLHISSYFGDFKSSRLFTLYGSDSTAVRENPLKVSRDKQSRDILQNLNNAANQTNIGDLEYLVNCGENIDDKSSIMGAAPIHKAVLS